MKFDLHSHTNVSDGKLTPAELLARACDKGVTHLAITDHDSVGAYHALQCPAGLSIISGIELSSFWRKRGVHVVGLNIEIDHPGLLKGIRQQQLARQARARKIADRLVKAGLPDVYEAVVKTADAGHIGRPHFAAHLVAAGHVPDMPTAFRKYLGDGKAGDVRDLWPPLDEIIGWIRAAGGTAVLAHPAQYKLTRSKLCELLEDFRAAGGTAMEVISGRQEANVTSKLAGLAQDFDLLASSGSDFHGPDKPWADLGCCPPLPPECTPVWETWQ
ncbi:MAG: PHP domain-containing protein [Woeseia sp.]